MKIQDAFPLLGETKLPWYQRLWLLIIRKTRFGVSYSRGTSKSCLEIMNMFERLKQSAKTSEERQILEQMQKEYGETMHDLTMSFWNSF